MSRITEPNTYDVKVTEAMVAGVGKNDSPAAVLTFTVDETGDHITENLFCTPAAISYTVDKLKDMGWQGEKMTTLSDDILGYECSIVVDVDPSSEKGYVRVKYINRRGSSVEASESASNNAQANLDAYLGALAAQPNTDLDEDDDLPI